MLTKIILPFLTVQYNTKVLYNTLMKYCKRIIIEDNEVLEGISLKDFARHSKFYQSHLSDMKNGKYIVGEEVYKKLVKAVTAYRKKVFDNIQK